MRSVLFFCLFIIPFSILGQVGINTTNPQGALDVTSEFMGMTVPTVPILDNVTTPNGDPPVDGTIVFAQDRESICFRIDGRWGCVQDKTACDPRPFTPTFTNCSEYTYIKASNADSDDGFATNDISDDGSVLIVGSLFEDSSARGINGNQSNNSSTVSGAGYIYRRDGAGTWSQEAYLKASNADARDAFGSVVTISGDGNTIAISAKSEKSNSNTINSGGSNNSLTNAGAVYIFTRSGSSWIQSAYIKPSTSNERYEFGSSISLSNDGLTLAVGVINDDSNAVGVNGTITAQDNTDSGAVYVYTKQSGSWVEQAYIKTNNPDPNDFFGYAIELSNDGNTLAASAINEDSDAIGINGDQTNNSRTNSGAVYIFTRTAGVWTHNTFVKSDVIGSQNFGEDVSMNGNGTSLAVIQRKSGGELYLYTKNLAGIWSHDQNIAYPADGTGLRHQILSLNNAGDKLLVGDSGDNSGSIRINGSMVNYTLPNSGAARLYVNEGAGWIQEAFIKANAPSDFDLFAQSCAISGDGTTFSLGSQGDDSLANTINGDDADSSGRNVGSVTVINYCKD